VTWAMVDALVELALYGSHAHAHLAHRGGLAADCRACRLTRETSHTALLDPVTERRGITATELHAAARAALLAERDGPERALGLSTP
jgi:predicted methyltransferase MtxX (methanogen marker protein 4)